MASINTREKLKQYCLRHLGHPVIEINVDDDQLEDRIDEALAMFREFHFDGLVPSYVKYQITSDDVTNKYIPITNPLVTGIEKILVLPSTNPLSMWNVKYQIFLNEIYNYNATSYTGYVITQQHLRNIEMLFSGETPIRFNRLTEKLYLDADWGNTVKAGDFIIIKCYVAVDPETNTRIWGDRWLKKYTSALFKRQWGENLSKYSGIQLVGGTTLNGLELYDKAVAELEKLEQQLRLENEIPPDFFIG
jgi:hypothetical protein